MQRVRDLRAAGESDRAIQKMRDTSDRLTWGVYVAAGLPAEERYRARCLAVLQRLKAGATLAGPSAAAFWGVPWSDSPPTRVYVRNVKRGGYADEIVVLPPGTAVEHNGVLLSTPEETIADCARSLRSLDALKVADAILGANLCTREHLQTVAVDLAGRSRVSRVRWIAQHADPLAESPGETHTRWLATQLGYDLISQFHVTNGQREAWLDFLVEGTMTGIEFDGVVKYRQERPCDRDAGTASTR